MELRKKNAPILKRLERRNRLKYLYGLSSAQFAEMERTQGGACAICREVQTTKRLAVDHCHATGRIRGLLCSGCNCALGLAKDRPGVLRAAAEYLERTSY